MLAALTAAIILGSSSATATHPSRVVFAGSRTGVSQLYSVHHPELVFICVGCHAVRVHFRLFAFAPTAAFVFVPLPAAAERPYCGLGEPVEIPDRSAGASA
jgi:hypothetical protein